MTEVGLKTGLRAIERAMERGAHSMPDSLITAGTVAYWACVIDERMMRTNSEYERARDATEGGRLFPGLRLVRNAITHGVVVCTAPTGMVFPLFADGTLDYGHDIWASLSVVEAGDWQQVRRETPRQRVVYREHFEGREISAPLNLVHAFINTLEAEWG